MRASKALIEAIKEMTGFPPKLTLLETEAGVSVSGIIAGRKFDVANVDQKKAEECFEYAVIAYLTEKEHYDAQQIVTDRLLFQVMMLEEIFCNIAAQSRHELGILRTMEYNKETANLNRQQRKNRKTLLMNEISNLMAQKKKFENPKFRLVTTSFENCNEDGAIEAKDLCVDSFIGAFDLFMENSKEAGTVIYPAVSVKKPGCKTFKTVIDKPKKEKIEPKTDYEPLRKQLVELIEKKEMELECCNTDEA